MMIDSEHLKQNIKDVFCRPTEKECVFYDTGGCAACPIDEIFSIIVETENQTKEK